MAERNPSKQKRAAQNKAQREALAARRVRAAAPKPAAPPRQTDTGAEIETGADADADAETGAEAGAKTPTRRRSRFRAAPAKTETGRPSRAAPSRPATTSRTTSSSAPAPTARSGRPLKEIGPDRPLEPGPRGLLAHLQQIAGGKAVLFAGIFSVVAAGMLLFAPVVPRQIVEAPADIVETVVAQQEGKPPPSEDDDPDPQTDQVTLLEAAGPLGVLLAGVPVVICGVAIEGSRRPGRRRLYTIAAFALGIYVAFFSVVGIFFFFSMAGLFVAAYQARKADPPVPRTRRGAASDEDEDDEG